MRTWGVANIPFAGHPEVRDRDHRLVCVVLRRLVDHDRQQAARGAAAPKNGVGPPDRRHRREGLEVTGSICAQRPPAKWSR